MQAKRWTATINNYTDDDVEAIKSFCIERNCQYAIFGKEIGEKGTRHLQGFIHLHKRARLNTIKKKLAKQAIMKLPKVLTSKTKSIAPKTETFYSKSVTLLLKPALTGHS